MEILIFMTAECHPRWLCLQGQDTYMSSSHFSSSARPSALDWHSCLILNEMASEPVTDLVNILKQHDLFSGRKMLAEPVFVCGH